MVLADRQIPGVLRSWTVIAVYLTFINCCNGIDLPCDYLDSINITEGIHQPNGSIIFNDIEFPLHHYANVSYALKGTERTTVLEHTRGCPCINKPCLRLCCPYGSRAVYSKSGKLTKICQKDESIKNHSIELIDDKNQTETIILNKHYGLVERSCDDHIFSEEYNITKTGEIWTLESGPVHHRNYCMLIDKDEETNEIFLEAAICSEKHEPDPPILAYAMLLSAPFIIATFLVYISISELRNFRGKCFLCYLACLLAFFLSLSWVYLNGSNYVEPSICKPIATLIYFSILSAFLWSNVITFDLWSSFQSGSRTYSERKRFLVSVLYACGVPLLIIISGFILDSLETQFRPGIGTVTCFLHNSPTTKFLFYHLPLCIIFSVNIVLIVLTARKAYQLQREYNLNSNDSNERRGNHHRRLKKKWTHFLMYLRLVIMMGITWFFEAISFVSKDSPILKIADFFNTLLGVVIFVLFVLNRRVLRLIKNRCQNWCGNRSNAERLDSDSSLDAQRRADIPLNQHTIVQDM